MRLGTSKSRAHLIPAAMHAITFSTSSLSAPPFVALSTAQ
eukprot:CAMPEP_0171980520 /NCGR_PEP_ID=MMETSP0993-20121228/261934_1 /TAXON_ID=483369 /ORGANISM="non described non described, Strain CCMP2098" /LENGTH=39 /DNA_ID= /DNA_START= /DNA_END= /DNA_ORIENTATION=